MLEGDQVWIFAALFFVLGALVGFVARGWVPEGKEKKAAQASRLSCRNVWNSK